MLELLNPMAASSSSFSCVGVNNTRIYSFIRHYHRAASFGVRHWLPWLTGLFSDGDKLVAGRRRVFAIDELGLEPAGDAARLALPRHLLIVALRSASELYGVLGLERGADEPAFSARERQAVESVAGICGAATHFWVLAQNLSCENLVLRALGTGDGLSLMADAKNSAILWANHPRRPIDWQVDVAPVAPIALEAARARRVADQRRSSEDRTCSIIAKMADVHIPELDLHPCTAIRLADGDDAASDVLSPREREVARLLVDGYSNINIAAIMSISENTIRTYVRRLYRKLTVCNRIELMRSMLDSSGVLPARRM
jgi:DNA-binding CsgD family transcriptional regulator